MKKIGIVCDNYKVERFKSKLIGDGFKIETMPFNKATTSIFIYVDPKDFESAKRKINAICINVEAHFKRSN